jgi:hypothetical protein
VSRWQAGCGQKDAWEQQKEDMQTGVSCASSKKEFFKPELIKLL